MAETKRTTSTGRAPKRPVQARGPEKGMKPNGPPPIDPKLLRFVAIEALARAFGGDHMYQGHVIKLPDPAEDTSFQGKRRPNEVAFARALLAGGNNRQWCGPVLAYGFHPDVVLATLVKLAMGATLDLPADLIVQEAG